MTRKRHKAATKTRDLKDRRVRKPTKGKRAAKAVRGSRRRTATQGAQVSPSQTKVIVNP